MRDRGGWEGQAPFREDDDAGGMPVGTTMLGSLTIAYGTTEGCDGVLVSRDDEEEDDHAESGRMGQRCCGNIRSPRSLSMRDACVVYSSL